MNLRGECAGSRLRGTERTYYPVTARFPPGRASVGADGISLRGSLCTSDRES